MTTITSTTSTVDLLAGNTVTTVQDDDQEKQNQFAKYLTVLKSSQLTEMQQKQMQTMTAQDERTKTLEKVNEKEQDTDEDKYYEAKDNGYTVAEMRRGLDLFDKIENRSSTFDVASTVNSVIGMTSGVLTGGAAAGEVSGVPSMLNGFSEGETGTVTNSVSGVTTTQVLQESINNSITYTAQTQAVQKNPQNGNAYKNLPMTSTLGSDTVDHGEVVSAKAIQHATRQSLQQTDITPSKLVAASFMGMTQVLQREPARQEVPLDVQTASMLKQIGETKEKIKAHQNTLTQNALSATTGTQQITQEMQQQASSSGRDVAESQMLPNTSLAEQVNQAQLTQRVASVFRSFSNQKSGTIRMKLHPEALGALTIRMQIDGGEVSAKLEAETETAKQILLENIETLKQKLKDQQLNIKSFEIEVPPKNREKRGISNSASIPMTSTMSASTIAISKSTTSTSTTSTLHKPEQKHDNPHVDVIG